jgi:hypothetical protein
MKARKGVKVRFLGLGKSFGRFSGHLQIAAGLVPGIEGKVSPFIAQSFYL